MIDLLTVAVGALSLFGVGWFALTLHRLRVDRDRWRALYFQTDPVVWDDAPISWTGP